MEILLLHTELSTFAVQVHRWQQRASVPAQRGGHGKASSAAFLLPLCDITGCAATGLEEGGVLDAV
jgi:hypothetical protein